jgi:phage terminase small subunit
MDIRTRKFKKSLKKLFSFEDCEKEILFATLLHLDQYYNAMDILSRDGLTIVSQNDFKRSHPAISISKVSWENFLKGLKVLKIAEQLQDKNKLKPTKIGRPLRKGF